ncbi:hypothetical protein BGW37DRAFT_522111 [Umbelopsis sp. PMI_123]|nr:hypothetical protein BGW37DRAFT_522111 [Umbelopsis sp. PMI_123]
MFKPQLLFVLMACMAIQSCHADLLPLLGLGGETSSKATTTHATHKAAKTTHHVKATTTADSGILGLSLPLLGGSATPSGSNLLSALLPTAATSSLNTAFPTGVSSGISANSSSASSVMLSTPSAALPTSSITPTSLAPPPDQSTPVVVLTSTIPPPAATVNSPANTVIPTAGLLVAVLIALVANM